MSGALCTQRHLVERNETGLLPRTRRLPGLLQVSLLLLLLLLLLLAIFVVYGEYNLVIQPSDWFYEHPYCTDRDILLFLYLLKNVLYGKPAPYVCLPSPQSAHLKPKRYFYSNQTKSISFKITKSPWRNSQCCLFG